MRKQRVLSSEQDEVEISGVQATALCCTVCIGRLKCVAFLRMRSLRCARRCGLSKRAAVSAVVVGARSEDHSRTAQEMMLSVAERLFTTER